MYPFDQTLVGNVLGDVVFQKTGMYIGSHSGLEYAVIDPRRHNINVWKKTRRTRPFRRLGRLWNRNYRISIQNIGPAFATNGPPMEPDVPWFVPDWAKLAWGVFWVGQTPWIPYGAVVSGRVQIDPGFGNVKAYFRRSGEGVFGAYSIAAGALPVANTDEGMGGLYHIVAAGATVTSVDVTNLAQAIGITAWGLLPLDDINTDNWGTYIPYINPPNPNPLNGLVIACGSPQDFWNAVLPMQLVTVGVRDAVAMDGSDSALVVTGRNIRVDCADIKDEIQQYGLRST